MASGRAKPCICSRTHVRPWSKNMLVRSHKLFSSHHILRGLRRGFNFHVRLSRFFFPSPLFESCPANLRQKLSEPDRSLFPKNSFLENLNGENVDSYLDFEALWFETFRSCRFFHSSFHRNARVVCQFPQRSRFIGEKYISTQKLNTMVSISLSTKLSS